MKAHVDKPKPTRGFRYEHTPWYTPLYLQNENHQCPQGEHNALQDGDARRIIERNQALKKVHNIIVASWSVMASYAYKSKDAGWYEGEEESSRPHYSKKSHLTGHVCWMKPDGNSTALWYSSHLQMAVGGGHSNKYYMYHEDYSQTTSECHEMEKALNNKQAIYPLRSKRLLVLVEEKGSSQTV
ncbi:hypothetical protein Cgig2_001092 [Carnegiea gigantea]|uniref:Uncharacterized protein n=1 Tax=Carnegiea gigantea TaxID=171969 RepID=A0A9Q1JV33_9CARY|nr:hypothetical protein Cgig2_001092 [Carnegiea gigantea]